MRETVLEAVLRSADAPSEVQRNRFAAFLKKQYGQEVPPLGAGPRAGKGLSDGSGRRPV